MQTRIASIPLLASLLLFTLPMTAMTGCGSSTPKEPPKFPPQPEGCEVHTFPEAPNVPTENIGPVSASCADTISDAECMRTLKDQACKLGADVIWGVSETPVVSGGKKKLSGRAAHTKAAGAGQ